MNIFQTKLLAAIQAAQALGVRQGRLAQNIERFGAVAAVKDYFQKARPTDGFDELARLGRLDLSAEAIAVSHHTEFTDEEINHCFSLLCAEGYYKA